MTYTSTITKKGQVTIPFALRDLFGLKEGAKIFIEAQKESQEIILKPKKSIFDLAGKFEPKKVSSALQIREKMVRAYLPR